MKYIISAVFLLFSVSSLATEVHYSVFTKHILTSGYTRPTYEAVESKDNNTYLHKKETKINWNERNELILVSTDSGFGIGNYKNSFYDNSWLFIKNTKHHTSSIYSIKYYAGSTIGVATGYHKHDLVKSAKTNGVLPIVGGYITLNVNSFLLSVNISGLSAAIATVGRRF